MASAGPRVPLIAPQLYQSGPRQQGPSSSSAQPGAPRGPALGPPPLQPRRPQVPGLTAPSARSVGPGARPASGNPPPRGTEDPQGAAPSGSGPDGRPEVPMGPQGQQAAQPQLQLSRAAGGALSTHGSLATTYSPPPDSSLPVIMGPAPQSQPDTQGQQDGGDRNAMQDDEFAADRQRETPGAEGQASNGQQPNSGQQPPAGSAPVGRTREQMGEAGLTIVQGGGGVTDDGMPVSQWSDGDYYMQDPATGNWFKLDDQDPSDGFQRNDGGWANGGNPDVDAGIAADAAAEAAANQPDPELGGASDEELQQLINRFGASSNPAEMAMLARARKEQERRQRSRRETNTEDQVGTTSSALTAGGQGAPPPSTTTQGGGQQSSGQQANGVTDVDNKVAKRAGITPQEAAALRQMGVRPQDITKDGYDEPTSDGPVHHTFGASDTSDFAARWKQRVAEGQAQGTTPDPGAIQSNIDETLRNALGNDLPEMDPRALEQRISAYRQKAAFDESRNLRLAMAHGAANGMSPGATMGQAANIGAQYGTQGAAQEADMRYQHELANYQAKMANAQRKASIYQQLLQGQLNEKDRATVLAAARGNAQLMAALAQQAQLFNHELNSPGAGDQFLAGLGAVGDFAGNLAPWNWGR